ncbi:MAG TPA: DUF3306 domain-containing protein [Burkholderiaceae bacterium]|nr:DUF3306 domain-containing protein [Burkholderiaceae bacterium]
MTGSDEGFLSRWARRKAQVRSGVDAPAEAPVRAVAPADAAVRHTSAVAPMDSAAPQPALGPAAEPPALPTMEDVARLTHGSDFASFVQPGIDPGVSNAAMKKLFSDPRYNVMDGLDTYIGDYNTPDPIPPSMLRQMNQAKFLGLFDDEDTDKPASEITVAAVTGAPTAAAAQPPAKVETGAPADAPEGRADDDTDL